MSQRKKGGFYVDDDDQETSMYFNGTQPNLYRDTRENVYNTGSPSQVFTPTSNMLYQQPQQSIPRAYNGSTTGYQRSTPTSMLQPPSPNRNTALGNLAQRGFHHMNQPFPTSLAQQQVPQGPPQQQTMQKRLANATNYSGFGQPQAFSFPPHQQTRSSGTPNSSGDMQQTSQVNIDLSTAEFPSLTNRNVPQSSMVPSIRNYVGMVGGSSKSLESGGEFSMQQEDFPALPGSSTSSTQNGPDTMTSKSQATSEAQTLNTKDSLSSLRTEPRSTKGVQTLQDGTVTNIPTGMLTDQYGMVGLLTFIRAADSDPNLVALAPGVDLTSLGLNLNAADNLYSTFQSPFSEGPCRPQDIDYHVPTEYLTNAFIREKLSEVKFNKYGEDLLFYLFYCNPGDGLQLAASAELYNRDWRYHKEEQVWITRAAGMEPQFKTNNYERGHYYVFDPQGWRRVVKELHLDYSKLEEKRTQSNQPAREQQLQQQQLHQQQQLQQQVQSQHPQQQHTSVNSTSVAASH